LPFTFQIDRYVEPPYPIKLQCGIEEPRGLVHFSQALGIHVAVEELDLALIVLLSLRIFRLALKRRLPNEEAQRLVRSAESHYYRGAFPSSGQGVRGFAPMRTTVLKRTAIRRSVMQEQGFAVEGSFPGGFD